VPWKRGRRSRAKPGSRSAGGQGAQVLSGNRSKAGSVTSRGMGLQPSKSLFSPELWIVVRLGIH
jgi:hypothetical protein